jgi:DNA-binding response OmpR family regulator
MASHIVVIEDDPALQDFYRLLLEAENYEVTISSTPFEDISALAALRPDLIILDILISGKQHGWDFLRQLKSSSQTSYIPILVSTASVTFAPEWQEFTQREGIPVIFKPFDIDVILTVIRQLLAKQP